MANGYYLVLKCTYGINSVYLSIIREEYITKIYEMSDEDFMDAIMDDDPFIEFYNDKPEIYIDMQDTASLNALIRNDSIETWFDRIK